MLVWGVFSSFVVVVGIVVFRGRGVVVCFGGLFIVVVHLFFRSFVPSSVGWLVGWSVGWSVGWLVILLCFCLFVCRIMF